MINKKEKGFTLVELLAVIVILAIILVIAVPKVMSVIEDSKKATLESTAKMIANAAEKQKVQNTVLGNTKEITCDSVAKINKGDYANCSVVFDSNTAKVTIEGSGKFDGLYVCDGTKTNAEASDEECINCLYELEEPKYTINDYDSCMLYMRPILDYNYMGVSDEEMEEFCSDKTSDIKRMVFGAIDEEWEVGEETILYTEDFLIDNNVISLEENSFCVKEETPESCFTYDKYLINNVESCKAYIADVFKSQYEDISDYTISALCEGDYTGEYGLLTDKLQEFIEDEIYTEDELVENNVLTVNSTYDYTITSYDETCGFDLIVIPKTIDGKEMTKLKSSLLYVNDEEPKVPYRLVIPETITKIEDGFLSIGDFNVPSSYHIYLANPNIEIGEFAFDGLSSKYNNIPW